MLATYLGNRYADAGWSRTDHYGWISGLLLELGITTLDELTEVLGRGRRGRRQPGDGLPLPGGCGARLDDVLLAVFRDRFMDLAGNEHRRELLQNRLEQLPQH